MKRRGGEVIVFGIELLSGRVTYKAKQDNPNKVNIDLNKMPTDSRTGEDVY